MKTIILNSKDKWVGVCDLKKGIRLMYVIMAMFGVLAIVDAITCSWGACITNILFCIWDCIALHWMKDLQEIYKFFNEKPEEIEAFHCKR